ncbi:hypothetical protein Thermo_00785 [Thermoplasmatales archaeon]|nr:hypothetical protein Thermo_00785 [Thermoplasmatales archaeon]
MEIDFEKKLSENELTLLRYYTDRPWKTSELQKKVEKAIPRATFYRTYNRLRFEYGLIYELSSEEKDLFGLGVEEHYIFHKDKRKAEKWQKVMEKIKDYDGKNSPYNFLTIIQREFSGYPLVSLEDVIEIARFYGKIPEEDIYNCERELFKFLEPQIRRLSPLLKKDERNSMSTAVRSIFESCTYRLLGATETNINEHSKTSFDVLCYVYTDEEAKKLVESLFTRNIDASKEQADIRAKLISDISEIFFKHYGMEKITALFEVKLIELEDREIDLSFEDPKKMGDATRLKNSLTQTLKKLSAS